MSETFAQRIKRIMGENLPNEIPRGIWPQNKKEYPHICENLRDNFIDGKEIYLADIKGYLSKKNIKYHHYARHLNSSQVMCISFFKKFFEENEDNQYLLRLLQNQKLPLADSLEIINAVFEYEPYSDEGTNFDFYMELNEGRRISMEIKYTEDKFGGIYKKNPCKYQKKWREIYSKLVLDSPYISTINEDEFEKNYQINRNVAYARGDDIVLFLTPRANNAKGINEGRNYIDSFNSPNIRNIYWEDLAGDLLKLVSDNKELRNYYEKFQKKYIDIL